MCLPVLSSNLQELYSALHQSKPKDAAEAEQRVVADPWGIYIYDSCRGWGMAWDYYYWMIKPLFGDKMRQENCNAALEKTKQCFLKEMENVKPHLERYQKYLQASLKEMPTEDPSLHASRKAITAWNNSSLRFQQVLRKEMEATAPEEFLKECERCQQIIDLEGIGHQQVPIAILYHLWENATKISTEEQRALKDWLQSIEHPDVPFNANLFHSSLKAIVSLFRNVDPENLQNAVTRMELALLSQHCTLLTQSVLAQVQWRASLKPGDKILYRGEELTLGRRLAENRDEWLFALAKDDEAEVDYLAIAISHNEAFLGMKECATQLLVATEFHAKVEQEQKERPNPEFALIQNAAKVEVEKMTQIFHSCSQDGRFALITRPYLLKDLPKKTIIPLKPMIDLFKWLTLGIGEKRSFSLKNLRFSSSGELMLHYNDILCQSSQKIHFHELDKLAYDLSRGKSLYYQTLLEQSKLSKHPTAKFFQNVIVKALESRFAENREEMRKLAIQSDDLDQTQLADLLFTRMRSIHKKCEEGMSKHLKSEANRKQLMEYLKKVTLESGYTTIIPTESGRVCRKKIIKKTCEAFEQQYTLKGKSFIESVSSGMHKAFSVFSF